MISCIQCVDIILRVIYEGNVDTVYSFNSGLDLWILPLEYCADFENFEFPKLKNMNAGMRGGQDCSEKPILFKTC